MSAEKHAASTVVSLAEYEDAANDYIGWCRTCNYFTRPCTEPDADNYDCPECGEDTVMGAEQAMLEGVVSVDINRLICVRSESSSV